MVFINAFAVALGTLKTPSTQYITLSCFEVYSGGGGDRHREAALAAENSTTPDGPELCKTLGTMERNYKRVGIEHCYFGGGFDEDFLEQKLRSLLTEHYGSVTQSVKAIASGQIVECAGPGLFAIAVPIKKTQFGTNNMNMGKWLKKTKEALAEIDSCLSVEEEDDDDE